MDLIYMDKNGVEIGVLKNYNVDIDIGDDNLFEITVGTSNNVLDYDYMFYIEGTEYGGIVDTIKVDTSKKRITYKGRTWRGVLESKIIEPDVGQDFYIISGNAENVIRNLVKRCSLDSLFSVLPSDINIPRFQCERYKNLYTQIKKMLEINNARVKIFFNKKMVNITAVKINDISSDEQYDNGTVNFIMQETKHAVNHMIGLGKGELKERQVVHKYMDPYGELSDVQHYFGIDEITKTYENTSVESYELLVSETEKKLKEEYKSSKMEMKISGKDMELGDIIGGKEYITGISMKKPITRKIVKGQQDNLTTNYEVGD
ncbi:Gp37-like protein [Lachnospiraceae bacterium LCP25S3_G4]